MMRRKMACGCIWMLLFFAASLMGYAADSVTYALDDVGLSVSLPSDYIVFTRDISETDPNLNAYGLTKESKLSFMTTRSIYLDAWPKSDEYEIAVIMADNRTVDFNTYSGDGLTQLAEFFSDEYEKEGITCIKYEIYQHAQTKFMKLYLKQLNNADMEYKLQYFTIYNSKPISITMQSYTGEITSQYEAVLKNIVDSVVFDEALQVTETHVVSGVYTDPETQTTFTVPDGWTEAPLSEPQEFLDAKFICDEYNSLMIMYGSYDVWSAMTESERAGLTRSDLKGTRLTENFAAEMFGVSPSDVDVVTYGGNFYSKMSTTTTNSSYGVEISLTMTQLLYMDNGYLYLFQFTGTDDDNLYYCYFEALLSSVEYKNPAVTDVSAISGNTGLPYAYDPVNLIPGLLITIAIYSLPIMIYRYWIKKTPVEPKKAKKITIIYGIFAFIAMAALMYSLGANEAPGGAILLWSFVNYQMLASNKKIHTKADTERPEDNAGQEKCSVGLPQEPALAESEDSSADKEPYASGDTLRQDANSEVPKNPAQTEIRYCHACGCQLPPDSQFCSQCGTKIPTADD